MKHFRPLALAPVFKSGESPRSHLMSPGPNAGCNRSINASQHRVARTPGAPQQEIAAGRTGPVRNFAAGAPSVL